MGDGLGLADSGKAAAAAAFLLCVWLGAHLFVLLLTHSLTPSLPSRSLLLFPLSAKGMQCEGLLTKVNFKESEGGKCLSGKWFVP